MPDSNRMFLDMFSDPERIAHYADGPRRFTPGLNAVHRMTAILLAEQAPADAHVLVLGAGGGLELAALAQAQGGWRFTGVDPAGPMLDLARRALAHTERGPSVRELFANGVNLATNSYELGLTQSPADFLWEDFPIQFAPSAPDLMEKTNSVNLTFRNAGGPLRFEVGVFYQDISDYIFARLIQSNSETGVRANMLAYNAADVEFRGVDGQASYQVDPASKLTVFGDYVDTNIRNSDDNLPRISPGRLGGRYSYDTGPFNGELEYYHTFEQDKVASYETRTPGYDMLNATLAYRFDLGQAKAIELYVRGSNLLDELAFVHTSFVKDQSPLRGRNFVIGMRHAF